ncbi:MAG: F0F1 ATP synthase subunit B' [Oscillatoria sp. PMC 1051.18]|uniref:F0F1 ATP synthase subunit B' n=1 Tax=Oscillatoria salina TaxID=331517 RepID=UPI0013BB95C2|nr:F0F1 ATP synthase subunit B' [Oscillatoria salina]MBZ8179363.1 F0F1 ATP synthase subunit B' [Oscillatoria salina IIICB1]MEC4892183.1 F0F1 ATP synthase subunit B' [Oscillatoria sp. PMC 1050.18]MEC5029339.1 F0F1 ATP synthase subunit B' [Oscillatoria sp. PMC 1051.18]NET87547.1 F0F1 ATP synthase subunit B' [Kamptonema sp. SIO1D9]
MMHWTFILATEAVETTVKEGGLFDFDATLPLMAVQFVILVALLNAVFYKPLGKAIDERADYIRKNIADARERKQKTQNLAQQLELELRDARRKSQDVIAAAQAEAQKVADAKIKEAQQEVQAEREKAAQEIEAQKAEAFGSLEGEVEALSNQILNKLLGAELVNK